MSKARDMFKGMIKKIDDAWGTSIMRHQIGFHCGWNLRTKNIDEMSRLYFELFLLKQVLNRSMINIETKMKRKLSDYEGNTYYHDPSKTEFSVYQKSTTEINYKILKQFLSDPIDYDRVVTVKHVPSLMLMNKYIRKKVNKHVR